MNTVPSVSGHVSRIRYLKPAPLCSLRVTGVHRFYGRLRLPHIDEMHTYRGVFGSHMANVIRRLMRVCRFYRSHPQFICCSSTIGNPAELATQLLGAPVTAITESGAPQGEKHLLLWNPPVINPDLGLRASARSQTTRLARAAIKAGLKTIVFANSRLMVEVLTKYLKDVFDNDPRKPVRIAAYRGGYLPTQRRSTEGALRAGDLDCVVATNALELGVDIGGLDVCILNGYPGTIAGTWQRLGRAGRRNRTSLGVLVATSDPLDQYIVRNPTFFTGASPEHARIAPDQLLILMDHVRCAAFELPFTADETFGGESLVEMLAHLEEQGVLHREENRWHWMADSYPASSVSLRSVADGNFVVVDTTGGKQRGDCRGELFQRRAYPLRGRDLHDSGVAMAGRTARLEGTQGVRHEDPSRLLHRCDRLHEAQDPRSIRGLPRRGQRVRPRRSSRGKARRRLQEDPLLQSRKCRLWSGQSARP